MKDDQLPPDIKYDWIPVASMLPPNRLVVYGVKIRGKMQTKIGMLQLIGAHWYGTSGSPSITPTHWRRIVAKQ